MVLQNLRKIIALSSLLQLTTSAFSARKSSQLVRSSSSSPSFALYAGAVVVDDGSSDEQDVVFLMNRATACANSEETCSLEEAQAYLEDVLLMQKDCLDVTLQDIQKKNPLCENVDVVAEVVAGLRVKIGSERTRFAPVKATVNAVNVLVGAYVVATLLHGFAAVPNVPVDAPLFAGFDAGVVNDRGVTGILPQEWYWAVRDGYFPSLFSEWFRNGGLVVDVSAFDSKAVAFTPQEWVWSIQNGSFGNMFRENLRYGGYLVDSTYDTEGMTPMTTQDVLWSVQGGYLGTAMKHFFRNGGV